MYQNKGEQINRPLPLGPFTTASSPHFYYQWYVSLISQTSVLPYVSDAFPVVILTLEGCLHHPGAVLSIDFSLLFPSCLSKIGEPLRCMIPLDKSHSFLPSSKSLLSLHTGNGSLSSSGWQQQTHLHESVKLKINKHATNVQFRNLMHEYVHFLCQPELWQSLI